MTPDALSEIPQARLDQFERVMERVGSFCVPIPELRALIAAYRERASLAAEVARLKLEAAESEAEWERLADLRFLARDKEPHQECTNCPTWYDGE